MVEHVIYKKQMFHLHIGGLYEFAWKENEEDGLKCTRHLPAENHFYKIVANDGIFTNKSEERHRRARLLRKALLTLIFFLISLRGITKT